MKVELEMWENIKKDMGYDESDNNEGYIYGIYYLDDVDIVGVEWYKTEQRRQEVIKKEKLQVINQNNK
tara:strand:- start:424 stop:627 length:204 start_codon:yes stop_codon:yes gene_type:complete